MKSKPSLLTNYGPLSRAQTRPEDGHWQKQGAREIRSGLHKYPKKHAWCVDLSVRFFDIFCERSILDFLQFLHR